jgi:hypothetical protein
MGHWNVEFWRGALAALSSTDGFEFTFYDEEHEGYEDLDGLKGHIASFHFSVR